MAVGTEHAGGTRPIKLKSLAKPLKVIRPNGFLTSSILCGVADAAEKVTLLLLCTAQVARLDESGQGLIPP